MGNKPEHVEEDKATSLDEKQSKTRGVTMYRHRTEILDILFWS